MAAIFILYLVVYVRGTKKSPLRTTKMMMCDVIVRENPHQGSEAVGWRRGFVSWSIVCFMKQTTPLESDYIRDVSYAGVLTIFNSYGRDTHFVEKSRSMRRRRTCVHSSYLSGPTRRAPRWHALYKLCRRSSSPVSSVDHACCTTCATLHYRARLDRPLRPARRLADRHSILLGI
jgi:hypothetical protein